MRFDTFYEAYSTLLRECYIYPDYESKPRDQNIRELTNVCFEITDPVSNMFVNSARTYPKKYLAGEMYWYFTGRCDLAFIEKYSKFWRQIADKDGNCTSAYGNLIFKEKTKNNLSEYFWMLQSLITDKDSRQAICHFNKPDHAYIGVKDFPCTIYYQAMIRDNCLNMHCYMRSNDMIKGLTFDIVWESLLMQQLHYHLEAFYPKLKIGSLYHNVTSLHIYESDFQLVDNMLSNPFEMDELPKLEKSFIDIGGNVLPDFENITLYNGDDKLYNWIKDHL